MDIAILSLVCLYAPNYRTDRKSFFKKVNNFIKENSIGITLVAGDFNEALKTLDRKSLNKNTKFSEPVLNSLKVRMKNHNFIDIWRILHKSTQQFTWRRKDTTQTSRIKI